jgi:hypothetical protein
MGFHGEMAQALIDAKAYAADEACTAERDAAIVAFFRAWELAMVARCVYYANFAVLGLLEATNDDEMANVLHEFAEGVALVSGFGGMPSPASGPLARQARVITDDEVDAAMAEFGVVLGDLGSSTTGTFVEDLPALEDAVVAFETMVKDIYGLTDDDIASFREPTPG